MAEERQQETAALEPKSLGFIAMETEPKENHVVYVFQAQS